MAAYLSRHAATLGLHEESFGAIGAWKNSTPNSAPMMSSVPSKKSFVF